MSRILLVDDDPDYAFALSHLLTRGGHDVSVATGGAGAVSMSRGGCFDVALVDLSLPDIHGLKLLDELASVDPLLPVICLTGSHDTSAVVQAMRKGAVDYLTKPADRATLNSAVAAATSTSQARRAEAVRVGSDVIGSSTAWRQTMTHIQAAASSPKTTVLITGDTGVGKEVTASLLHALSARRKAPLVQANAACFSPSLMESELFGHEAGAFTGAVKRRRGLFEQADGGVLFLDEIGELAIGTQAKLLRALENRRFKRVGGVVDLQLDATVIAATNRDLKKEVKAGRFREDLYFRLAVVPIEIPSLRQRPQDIEAIALAIVESTAKRLGRTIAGVSGAAIEALRTWPWPGNVRELRNVIERVVILKGDSEVIDLDELPIEIRSGRTAGSGAGCPFELPAEGVDLAAVERGLVEQALARTNGNQTQAAKLLGISRFALRHRMDKHDVDAGERA